MPGTEPLWLELARADIGVRETPGPANNARVMQYYADAGHPEIAHETVAWCAAFACAQLERAGVASPKSLTARSFLKWGKAVQGPLVGAIVVTPRGDPNSWTAHVGFVTRWNATTVWTISGNTGDAVVEAPFDRSTVLGYRVPVTAANSRTVKAATAGAVSGTVAVTTRAIETAIPAPDTLAQIGAAGSDFAGVLQTVADVLPLVGAVAGIISIIAAAVTLYARLDDLKNKGR